MANEKGPQTEQEKKGTGLSTRDNPEAFEVFQQVSNSGEVNPDLYGNEEAVLEDLKRNHVKTKEAKFFGYDSMIVSIDLPAVGDFQGLKMNIIISSIPTEILKQNDELNTSYLSGNDISNLLLGMSHYMNCYGVDIDGSSSFECTNDFENVLHNDTLRYFFNLLPLGPGSSRRILLKGGNVLINKGEGNYVVGDISHSFDGICSLINLSDSLNEKVIDTIPGYHYEYIDLLDWNRKSNADKIMEKMDELKNANLVLVYRDNEKYSAMAEKLNQLVKFKYGGKVYIIEVPRGIEKNELSEQDLKTITEVLSNCKCMTDGTISEWTGVDTEKIEDDSHENKTEFNNQLNDFLSAANDIEKYCIDKGIDTIYVLSSYRAEEEYNYAGKEYHLRKLLLEHGGFCQKEDGKIYYIDKPHDQDEEHYNDAKRFWKNLFPNLNVEFIEDDKLKRLKTEVRNGEWYNRYDFNYKKSKGALAIVDRHFKTAGTGFEEDGGEIIEFAGDCFERVKKIRKKVSESLAEKICERKMEKN